jgi:hypothetical protein
MDPITIGFLLWLGERFASLGLRGAAVLEKKQAEAIAADETHRLLKAREDHALQVLETVRSVHELEEQRGNSARRRLTRTVKVAGTLATSRGAFTTTNGWFGGRSVAEVQNFIDSGRALHASPLPGQMSSNSSGAVLVLAQGVALLEKTVSGLEDLDLEDLVASLPFSGSVDLAAELGAVGEIGAGEILGLLGVALSAGAFLSARKDAAEIRAQAKEISASSERISEVSNRLLNVAQNCNSVREQLRVMDYHQFKLAWAAEQLTRRYPRELGMPRRYRPIVDAFASHARLFWSTLTTYPLAEVQKSARV